MNPPKYGATLRRTALAAASIALLVGASACSAAPAANTDAQNDAPFPESGSGEVNFFNFTNFVNPDALAKFTADTGITVNVDTFSSAEEMVAKVKTGSATYDVVALTDYVAEDLIDSGQLMQIDVPSWPNGGNIEDDFIDVHFDEGRKFTTPYAEIYNGIGVNTSVVTTPITSWADYFAAPQEARGKIGLHDDQTFIIDGALLATGGEPCTTDGEAYQKAYELLEQFSPNIKIISSDGTIDRLAGGETTLSTMWNGSFSRAQAQNADLQYVLPAEGYLSGGDSLAILSNANNPDNAKIFMNWLLDPENAALNANWIKYYVPVKGLEAELDKLPDDGASVIVPTAEEAARAIVQVPCSADVKEQYDKLWTMFKG
ncbi:ABC transporter substrate-binding protein [Leucobacter chromiireducens]|uniref:Spermidine/putrescine ABC transporter substrate-binding protein n=1 Tax=Leucobacter chromiireducens subsp. solipictus TaxID=398235 RepID=A0ABS1SDJ7_9MICO|nr:spermidine/putrescine ABC transporter substrate-binding protein [Leucobacter chromiireducens]MBL3678612.1 spermidine/putrescine ABC transporter substrate-binding protein [Leucobacter chromiireducens subsp. solipictus]